MGRKQKTKAEGICHPFVQMFIRLREERTWPVPCLSGTCSNPATSSDRVCPLLPAFYTHAGIVKAAFILWLYFRCAICPRKGRNMIWCTVSSWQHSDAPVMHMHQVYQLDGITIQQQTSDNLARHRCPLPKYLLSGYSLIINLSKLNKASW